VASRVLGQTDTRIFDSNAELNLDAEELVT
jgi:hypothetical protein